MKILLLVILIWALSSLVVASYMSRRLKDPNAARIAVTLIPIVNTLFALAVIVFTFTFRIREIGLKSIIKEFKDIKK